MISLMYMELFSYSRSNSLNVLLKKIESLRRRILLTSLSPKIELALQWEATLSRIYNSLSLVGNPLSKREMIKLISQSRRKRLKRDQWEVVKYKKALEWLNRDWLVNLKKVSVDDILNLYNLACYGKFRLKKIELKRFLDFIQTETEHPVVKAAIAQIQLIFLKPFSGGNRRTGCLLSYLFLYKHGYDFRRLLVLEEYMRRDVKTLKAVGRSCFERKNLTVWLEYFAEGIVVQLEKASNDIDNASTSIRRLNLPASFWELSDRQKEILTFFEQPGMTITNRKVQALFNVSQITASRDLSKLTALGLLFTYGKGRSVYYTRV